MQIINLADFKTQCFEAAVELFDQYRQFYQQVSDLSAAKQFLAQRLKDGSSTIYLAVIDGQPVGFCQLYPVFSSVQLKTAWVLNDLYVDVKARQQGVAKALLAQAKQLGAQTDAAFVGLCTAQDNVSAQTLYQSFGFNENPYRFYLLADFSEPLPEEL